MATIKAAFESVLVKDWLGPLVAVIAVLVGVLQYRSTSSNEFLKPVREAQLKNYQEASSAAAILATAPESSPAWNDAHREFLRLYYGPLAMFEDFDHTSGARSSKEGSKVTVESAMILFKTCLTDTKKCADLGSNLMQLSLALSHAARQSLGQSWGYSPSQLTGDYQKFALAYQERLKENMPTNNR